MSYRNSLIFIHRFFRDFTPFSPFMAVYFAYSGLSISAISILFLAWSATSTALEIPTGILADRYGRKTLLVLAQLSKLAGFAVWLIAPSFMGFLCGIILWGIAASLDSGTFQAFLYDLTRNTEDNFKAVYGKSSAASFAGLFAATILASLTIKFGFHFLLILSILGLGISLVAILLLPSVKKRIIDGEVSTISHKTIVRNIEFIWKHKLLLSLIVVGVSATGIKAPLDEYHALLFESRNIPLFLIGFIIAGFELAKSLGAFLSTKIRIQDQQQNFLLAIIGLLLAGIIIAPSYLAVVLLIILILVDMILWMSNDTAIQHLANDNNRATLMSIKAFAGETIAGVMFGIFSILTKYHSVSSVYFVSGAILIIIAGLISYVSFSKKSA